MSKYDIFFMDMAINEAKIAFRNLEVPVGAAVVKNNRVVSLAQNSVEKDSSSLMHAEIKAIYNAQKKLGSWRLNECTIYVTLEPCLMCCGAIILSRMKRLVYGAADPKSGAAESLYNTLNDKRLNHRVEIVSGIMKGEAANLLTNFFAKKRNM
jgi:tRNA(adenine34) deaminase